MNSRDKNTPLLGGRQGYALVLGIHPLEDPYAHWRLQADGGTGMLLPVRRIPLKRKSFSGHVPYPGDGAGIWYESLLEQRFLLALMHLKSPPEVLGQPMTLKMQALGYKGQKYTPDYLVWAPGVRPTLIEVKYEKDLKKNWERLKPKLMAARRYANWRGWNFRLVTDRHLHPDGIQQTKPPSLGLVCPYRRTPTTIASENPRPVIWGALPGATAEADQVDRSHLLIPPTLRLLTRILRPGGAANL